MPEFVLYANDAIERWEEIIDLGSVLEEAFPPDRVKFGPLGLWPTTRRIGFWLTFHAPLTQKERDTLAATSQAYDLECVDCDALSDEDHGRIAIAFEESDIRATGDQPLATRFFVLQEKLGNYFSH